MLFQQLTLPKYVHLLTYSSTLLQLAKKQQPVDFTEQRSEVIVIDKTNSAFRCSIQMCRYRNQLRVVFGIGDRWQIHDNRAVADRRCEDRFEIAAPRVGVVPN